MAEAKVKAVSMEKKDAPVIVVASEPEEGSRRRTRSRPR
ncbi:hypothetical protein SVIOM342S_02459 [Streptomyces violaceorubidus]